MPNRQPRESPLVRFGVVVPVHNEEQLVPAALSALDRAIARVSGGTVVVGVAVVLDACTDASADLVTAWLRSPRRPGSGPVDIIETEVANVGRARRIGFERLLQRWADVDTGHIWLGTTDADSEVPGDWIASQLAVRREGGQVWAGAVSVRDWSGRAEGTADLWLEQYSSEHLPIHGANFGIEAALYLEAGGFGHLPTGEDRDLFERTVALGAVIRHDRTVRVVTSSRRQARAPHGFAHALSSLEARALHPSTAQVLPFPAPAMAQPDADALAGESA